MQKQNVNSLQLINRFSVLLESFTKRNKLIINLHTQVKGQEQPRTETRHQWPLLPDIKAT